VTAPDPAGHKKTGRKVSVRAPRQRTAATPDPTEYALDLTRSANEEMDSGAVPLSVVIGKAARIARLRRDFDNLFWLEMEMVCLRDPSGGPVAFVQELKPHYTKSEWTSRGLRESRTWQSERQMPYDIPTLEATKDHVEMLSVAEIETKRVTARRLHDEMKREATSTSVFPGENSGSAGLLAGMEMFDLGLATILDRIRARVRTYLSQTETDLVLGTTTTTAIERLMAVAEAWLAAHAPSVLAELRAASERCADGTTESFAQALLACRRAIMSLADALYPARDAPTQAEDGQEHKLTQDKYINRLMQYLKERLPAERHCQSINANLADAGRRIETAHNLAQKGLHSKVTNAEAHSCVAQTWLVIADLVLLEQGSSAALSPDTGESSG
jgi:hypothetical protein